MAATALMQVKRKGGRQWRRLRAQLLDQEPLCRLCMGKGRVTAATEVDHIVPLHKGGREFDANNLRPVPSGRDQRRAWAPGQGGDRA